MTRAALRHFVDPPVLAVPPLLTLPFSFVSVTVNAAWGVSEYVVPDSSVSTVRTCTSTAVSLVHPSPVFSKSWLSMAEWFRMLTAFWNEYDFALLDSSARLPTVSPSVPTCSNVASLLEPFGSRVST